MKFVYLHGFASGPGSKKARYFQERMARAGMELLVPDLAAGDFEHLTISGQLAIVEQVAGGGRAVLIGSSLGGYLAALYAARRPREVRRVVLLAPAFSFPRLFAAGVGEEGLERWRSSGRLSVFHYGAGEMRDLGYQILEDGAQYEDFPGFHQPALLFHGRSDASVPVRLSEDFAAGHSNVRLRVMESDHELINVLDALCSETLNFLAEEQPEASRKQS